MNGVRFLSLFLFVLSLILSGCEAMKTSRPIIPIKEYERMIVGRLDAEYVGTQNCLSACHYHDTIKKSLDASTMGLQISRKSGFPLLIVNPVTALEASQLKV